MVFVRFFFWGGGGGGKAQIWEQLPHAPVATCNDDDDDDDDAFIAYCLIQLMTV